MEPVGKPQTPPSLPQEVLRAVVALWRTSEAVLASFLCHRSADTEHQPHLTMTYKPYKLLMKTYPQIWTIGPPGSGRAASTPDTSAACRSPLACGARMV